MSITGVGDLASSLLARRSNADLKREFVSLSQELASGRRSDVFAATGGNVNTLNSVEHSLRLLDAYDTANAQFAQKLNHAEIALDAIAQDFSGLGPQLLASADSGDIANSAIQAGAANKLQSTITALSVRVGPAYVFSGTASDTPPLADADTLLSELQLATAGITTAADYYQAVDDWFMQPGGFDLSGYTGGAQPTQGVKVSETDEIKLELTAESTEIRMLLRDISVIALIDQNNFGGNDVEKAELTKFAASGMIAADAELIKIRATLGELQQNSVDAVTQNLFQNNSLSELKNEMMSVDLFETAARFEEVQLQLESLYLVTAKTARLTLTGYLR